jgi:flagellar L-ring protein precursor FlgH
MTARLLVLLPLALPAAAQAQLYRHDNWAAIASDRRAAEAGDILTVVVLESSTATNSVQAGSGRETRVEGSVSAGASFNESASLGVRGRYDGSGQTSRSGRMVAQISVRVEQVHANGDLTIAGASSLNIGGERTDIRIRGRIRQADISADNTILSGRIADAEIAYDGRGFASRSARPGILQRIFGFLGLM